MDTRPIGIFDSGSGGLSILRAIRAALPQESIVYFGDHAYVPYSERKTDFIVSRATRAISFLRDTWNVKLVVIACNTATVAGISEYRAIFPDIPIIGVVPVVKTAANESKTGHIAVFSTSYTANSAYQRNLIETFGAGKTMYSVGSPSLVSFIETGKVDGNEICSEIRRIVAELHDPLIDVAVLGCTHFSFIRHAFTSVFGDGVRILDSGAAVARQTERILSNNGIKTDASRVQCMFLTSGDPSAVNPVASLLLDLPAVFQHTDTV